MSKSKQVLIDTTNAQSKTTITTMPSLATTTKAGISTPIQSDTKTHNEAEKTQPSSYLRPHTNHGKDDENMKRPTIESTIRQSDYNHRQHDETQVIVDSIQKKQYERNNIHHYEITTKPLMYNAQQLMLQHDNRHDDVVDIPSNNKKNDGTLSTFRNAPKISKSIPPSSKTSFTTKIKHQDIETTLFVFCVLIIFVTLVICTIILVRNRRKTNKYCDKANLIGSSASCSSTTSINDCGMDFNRSTTCIAYSTAIHV